MPLSLPIQRHHVVRQLCRSRYLFAIVIFLVYSWFIISIQLNVVSQLERTQCLLAAVLFLLYPRLCVIYSLAILGYSVSQRRFACCPLL
jgi:hypothetical protein